MDFKQTIIENAWGGFSMDYGLLHFQLATPIMTLLMIAVMVLLLNKLLFQPVIRTLDNRKEVVNKSMSSTSQATAEIERLGKRVQEKLRAARTEVSELTQEMTLAAKKQKSDFVAKESEALAAELQKGRDTLQAEVNTAREELRQFSVEISETSVKLLLN